MSKSSRRAQPYTSLQFLADCLSVSGQSGDDLRELITSRDAASWSQALQLAGSHLVTPTLAWALERGGLMLFLRDEEREYLEVIRALNRERNDVLRGELIRIISTLNGIGVTPLLLKGAISLALPEHYRGAADRVVGDLDIMVDPDRAIEAQAVLETVGYRTPNNGRELVTKTERDRHHHLAPLVHDKLPVCVEVHTRFVKELDDSRALEASVRRLRWQSPTGATAFVPDETTRIAHNFIHSQITNELGIRKLINLRHLHEFAGLVTSANFSTADIGNAIGRGRLNRLSEYWALAEYWLKAPFPQDLPRSPGEARTLWMVSQVMQRPAWRRSSDASYFAYRLPGRAIKLLARLFQIPGYARELLRRLMRSDVLSRSRLEE